MIPIYFQVTCSKVKVKLLFWAQCVFHFIYFNPLVTCFIQVLLLQRIKTWILHHGGHRCFWNISCYFLVFLNIPLIHSLSPNLRVWLVLVQFKLIPEISLCQELNFFYNFFFCWLSLFYINCDTFFKIFQHLNKLKRYTQTCLSQVNFLLSII